MNQDLWDLYNFSFEKNIGKTEIKLAAAYSRRIGTDIIVRICMNLKLIKLNRTRYLPKYVNFQD